MFTFLYTIGIRFYWFAACLIAPFNEKARLFVKGRKNLLTKIEDDFRKENASVAWFHCASLGEFEQGRPVLEAFKEEFPRYKILLTFFSPSGYEIRKNYAAADYIYYLPIDTASNAQEFVKLTSPKVAFFVKYEFWHHYTKTLHQAKIPLISFSAIFRPNQLFFKPYGTFYRNVLHRFSHIFTQNEQSLALLKQINITNTALGGDTRFDRVYQICEQKKEIDLAKAFRNNQPTLVIGSAWASDMEVIASVLDQFEHPLKIIIAPHEIGESYLKEMEAFFHHKSCIRYSQAKLSTVAGYDMLLIDNIGLLSSLYQYGDFAYIGGAFGKGLHNILEAATFGMPLFFGNRYDKFQEAKDLVKLGGAFPLENEANFQEKFSQLYLDSTAQKEAETVCKSYVNNNLGATRQIIEYCRVFLHKN